MHAALHCCCLRRLTCLSPWPPRRLHLLQVVAADLRSRGGKDWVEFKIRVGDLEAGGAGGTTGEEWSVSRRYRNFEVLHRQLRCYQVYRCACCPGEGGGAGMVLCCAVPLGMCC